MTDYPKSSGITHIKRLLKKSLKDNRIKHISLTLEQAQDIMNEMKMDNKQPEWSLKSNSLRAGATVLCIEPKELLERLTCDKPSKLRNDLAEARNKIKSMELMGDRMLSNLEFKYQELYADEWHKTKKLYL
jgi:hypothetical protein